MSDSRVLPSPNVRPCATTSRPRRPSTGSDQSPTANSASTSAFIVPSEVFAQPFAGESVTARPDATRGPSSIAPGPEKLAACQLEIREGVPAVDGGHLPVLQLQRTDDRLPDEADVGRLDDVGLPH